MTKMDVTWVAQTEAEVSSAKINLKLNWVLTWWASNRGSEKRWRLRSIFQHEETRVVAKWSIVIQTNSAAAKTTTATWKTKAMAILTQRKTMPRNSNLQTPARCSSQSKWARSLDRVLMEQSFKLLTPKTTSSLLSRRYPCQSTSLLNSQNRARIS